MKKILLTLVIAVSAVSLSFASTSGIRYSGEVNVGFATGNKAEYDDEMVKSSLNRPFIETIHGVTISKYTFVGAGVGVHGYFGAADKSMPEEKWNTIVLPLFVNLKGMLPLNGFTPYVTASFGGSILPYSGFNTSFSLGGIDMKVKLTGGFYCDCGVGVKLLKKLNVGLGVQHQQMGMKIVAAYDDFKESEREEGYKGTSFYIKVGFCW